MLINLVAAGSNDSQEINRIMLGLYMSKSFRDLADTIATRFITLGNTIDAKTWREAAKGGSRGREIFYFLRQNLKHGNVGNVLEQKIIENAHYIKTLPLNVAQDITKFVQTEAYKGLRASEIAKVLMEKVSSYSEARADLIARTESSKAMTALTEARAKDVGVDWYVWRTADDARVRNSHAHMEGVLCRWDDPPSPEKLVGKRSVGRYNAGNIYNCRCYPRPLITLNNIAWPAKVHVNGEIVKMTREQFEKLIA